MKKILTIFVLTSLLLPNLGWSVEDDARETALPNSTPCTFVVSDEHFSKDMQRDIRKMLTSPSPLDLSKYGKVLIIGGAQTQRTFLGRLSDKGFIPSNRIGMVQHPDVFCFDDDPYFQSDTGGEFPPRTPFLEQLAKEFREKERLTIGNFDVNNSSDFKEFARNHKGNFGLIALDYATFHYISQDLFPDVLSLLKEKGILFIPATLVSEVLSAPVFEYFRGLGCDVDLLPLGFPIDDQSHLKQHEAFLASLSAEHLGLEQTYGHRRAIYYIRKATSTKSLMLNPDV